MPKLLVECEVQSGLLRTEYLVSLYGSSFLVDRGDVRVERPPVKGELLKGRVLAYLITIRNDHAVIEMTGTPVNGSIRVSVPKEVTTAA